MSQLPQCNTCHFYAQGGYCRRHAPRKSDPIRGPEWPRVSMGDWCGDWRATEVPTFKGVRIKLDDDDRPNAVDTPDAGA